VALGTPRLGRVLGPAFVPSEEVTSIMSMLLLRSPGWGVMGKEGGVVTHSNPVMEPLGIGYMRR
jgi:hypothetical protein